MIGQLRERVTIQGYTISRQTDGTPVKTWADYKTVYAQRQHRTDQSGEVMNGAATVAERYTVWTIRDNYAIDAKMRLVFNGQAYNIVSVLNELPKRGYAQLETEDYDANSDTTVNSVASIQFFRQISTGSGTTVTVTENGGNLPGDTDQINVYRNGVFQTEGASNDYTVSGSDIVFNYDVTGDRVVIDFTAVS